MTLERCSFSKITTTTWSGRGTTAMVSGLRGLAGRRVTKLPGDAGIPIADLRDSAGHMVAIPVAEPNGTVGLAADDESAAVQTENPISSITATAQPIHGGKARPWNSFAAPERSMRTIQRGLISSAQPPRRRR